MATIRIPRLDLEVKGIDSAVVRAALERLPAPLTAALQRPSGLPPGEAATVRVSTHVDAAALASELARRIAAIVHHRTPARMHPRTRPGARGGNGA